MTQGSKYTGHIFLLFVVLCFVNGCGGGSGGSKPAISPTPTPTPAPTSSPGTDPTPTPTPTATPSPTPSPTPTPIPTPTPVPFGGYNFKDYKSGVSLVSLSFTNYLDDDNRVTFSGVASSTSPSELFRIAPNGSVEHFPAGFFGVNSRGVIAYLAPTRTEIFIKEGGSERKIVDNTDPRISSFRNCAISDNNAVAFVATKKDSSQGVFIVSASNEVTEIDVSALGLTSIDAPSINNNGQIAFQARRTDDSWVIVLASPGKVDVVADSRSGDYIRFDQPKINNQGKCVFVAFLPRNEVAILLVEEGKAPQTLIETETTPYRYFEGPVMNDKGQMAFAAAFDSIRANRLHTILFREAEGTLRTVYTQPDTLLGKAVNDLGMAGLSLNNKGAILFDASMLPSGAAKVVASPK